MLKCLLLAKWFNPSDPSWEEMLQDRLSFRRFAPEGGVVAAGQDARRDDVRGVPGAAAGGGSGGPGRGPVRAGVAAIGGGSRHAIPGLLGMFAGGAAFAYAYPALKTNLLKAGEVVVTLGETTTDKVTLADVSGLSPWWFIAALIVVAITVFALVERFAPRPTASPDSSPR